MRSRAPLCQPTIHTLTSMMAAPPTVEVLVSATLGVWHKRSYNHDPLAWEGKGDSANRLA
jgi:hypothetical protein